MKRLIYFVISVLLFFSCSNKIKKLDERGDSISCGDTVLINVIPDGIRYKKEWSYYLVISVFPNKQLLLQAIDSVSGKIIQKALRNNKNSSTLKLASKKLCDEYLSRIGLSEKNTEAVYYYDGSINTDNLIYSWKYCINTNESKRLMEVASLKDCVFLDPWVISESNADEKLTVDNAFFSKMGYKHRIYKINSDKNFKSLAIYHNIFEPID